MIQDLLNDVILKDGETPETELSILRWVQDIHDH
jgi:hypothetical protein